MPTPTHISTLSDTTDQASKILATFTPSANKLITVFVASSQTAGNPPEPTLTGNSLTWVKIATVIIAVTRRLTAFRALGATPTNGTLTADFGGATQIGISGSIIEWADVPTTGSDGAGAVGSTPASNTATATTLSVALTFDASTTSGTLGAFYITANEALTEGSGFTLLGQSAHAGPNRSLMSEGRTDSDTGVDASWTSSVVCGGLAIEILHAAAGGVTYARQRSMTGGFREMTGGLVG